jgi:Na+-translocating ferredoxin:NAD+ oxidoreductase RnfC subunit
LADGFPDPLEIRVPLQQHIGKPAVPLVKTGDWVTAGQLVADIPEGSLGARLHAPLAGRVSGVSGKYLCIEPRTAAAPP